jgi:predicted nucleic acid-binding protein
MGILAALQGQRTYLDTNIWIYAIEGYSTYAPALTDLFSAIDSHQLQAVTSELTLAEVLVKPLIDRNLQIQLTKSSKT